MDNSLLSLMENSENITNINNNDDRILNSIIFVGLNILLFINYSNIYINLLIFMLLYSVLGNYLIVNKKILNKEANIILLFTKKNGSLLAMFSFPECKAASTYYPCHLGFPPVPPEQKKKVQPG